MRATPSLIEVAVTPRKEAVRAGEVVLAPVTAVVVFGAARLLLPHAASNLPTTSATPTHQRPGVIASPPPPTSPAPLETSALSSNSSSIVCQPSAGGVVTRGRPYPRGRPKIRWAMMFLLTCVVPPAIVKART